MLQATEAIKILLNIGKPLYGELLRFNLLDSTTNKRQIPQPVNCALCGKGNELKNYREYATFMNTGMTTELTVEQVKADWANLQFLDVREADEYAEFNLSMPNIPTSMLMNGFNDFTQFDPEQPLLIVCAHGVRSKRAAELCKAAGFKTVYSLKGGLAEWHD